MFYRRRMTFRKALIFIGGADDESLGKVLPQLHENFWRNIEARRLKVFSGNSDV